MRRSHLLAAAGLSLFTFAAWAVTETWPLDDAANYDFDPSLVAVESGSATLIPDVRGTGADGDLDVVSATFDLSVDMTGNRTVADGAAWWVSTTLASGDTAFDLDGYVDGLAAGDEILLREWVDDMRHGGSSAHPHRHLRESQISSVTAAGGRRGRRSLRAGLKRVLERADEPEPTDEITPIDIEITEP